MSDELTGRELDAAVAERCLGNLAGQGDGGRWWMRTYPNPLANRVELPSYSESMAFAWPVAEWIREQTGVFVLEWNSVEREWQCGYMDLPTETRFAYAPTAEEAICRAALALAERLAEGK